MTDVVTVAPLPIRHSAWGRFGRIVLNTMLVVAGLMIEAVIGICIAAVAGWFPEISVC